MTTYDQLDFHILLSIINSKNIGFSEIINGYKLWTKPNFETSNQRRAYFTAKRTLIIKRLKKFILEELVFIEKGEKNRNIYIVDKKKVKILNRHLFLDKYKKALWIKEKDGIECIFSL